MPNETEIQRQSRRITQDVESCRLAPSGPIEQAQLRALLRDVNLMRRQFPNDYQAILTRSSQQLNSELPSLQLDLGASQDELIITNRVTHEALRLRTNGDAFSGTVVLTITRPDGTQSSLVNPDHPLGSGGPRSTRPEARR